MSGAYDYTKLVVHPRDIRAAKLCMDGARDWWKNHGLVWADFVSNGISADKLLAFNDGMAEQVVACARARENG